MFFEKGNMTKGVAILEDAILMMQQNTVLNG